MLIFDTNNIPIILESIYTPTVTQDFWVLDLEMLDFTLAPLTVLEEIYAPTMELTVNGFAFNVPTNWYILVVDEETSQLDSVEVADVTGREFKGFIQGIGVNNYKSATIYATNYFPDKLNVSPSLSKHQMLCHPISENLWINISPSDAYNKYLKNLVVGDLI